jgi:predicted nuclease of predicted toxin-antitoxin system
MKFIVDVGVGRVIEQWLINEKHDVLSVASLNPSMEDKAILAIANSEARIVITMDKDFGELIFNGKHSSSGVLLLRLEEATADEKLKVIIEIFGTYIDSMPHNFCVYQNKKLRIKHLK